MDQALNDGKIMSAVPGLHVVPPEGGKPLDVLGDTIIRKVSSDESGGGFAVYKEISPPGGGAPLHVHHATDEIFYVLEGEYEVTCGDRTFTAAAGAYAVLPRGVPHAFRNTADSPSTLLVTIVPGAYVKFFEEIDAFAKTAPVDEENLARIAGRHDIEFF